MSLYRCAARQGVRLLAAIASLASASIAPAQVWIANPPAIPSDHWCNAPVLESIVGDAPWGNYAVSWRWIIRFNVRIASGVHENFGADMLPPRTLNQLAPAENWPSTMSDQQLANLYLQEFPDAHYVFVFPHNAIVSDCNGDGMPILGPGTPPCWGEPVGMLERTDFPYPTLLRSSMPNGGACATEAKFKLQVSAFPLINRGAVGIRIKGKNAGYWLGMTAWSTPNDPRSGHAWVHLLKMAGNGPQHPGFHEAYGKWPKRGMEPSVYWPFAPGEIRDEPTSELLNTAWFPVTVAEFNAAKAVIDREREHPSNWSLTRNCTDFAIEVMTAAGCPIPSAVEVSGEEGASVQSPRAFNRSCRRILEEEHGILPRCGYVFGASQQFSGAGPELFDAGIIAERMIEDPHALAADLEFSHDLESLEPVSLRVNAPLTLSIDRPEASFVLVDFGDGTVKRHDGAALSHAYAGADSYAIRVIAVQNGQVAERTLTAAVAPKGPKGASASCTIPPVPPIEFENGDAPFTPVPWGRTFPADVTCDWVANGEDLALVLAAWGTTESTIADIDGDGVVSGNDLAIVLAGWGSTGQ